MKKFKIYEKILYLNEIFNYIIKKKKTSYYNKIILIIQKY